MEVGSTEARVNGRPVILDVPATSNYGRTMVPLRFVSESLGAEVSFSTFENTVTIQDASWHGRPGHNRPGGWNRDGRDRDGRLPIN